MQTRLIMENDAEKLSRYFAENAKHFSQWQPARRLTFDSLDAWKARIKTYSEQQNREQACYFVLVDDRADAVIAHCTLSQISRGAFQACYMGYGISASHEGLGRMRSTCEHAISYAFDVLKLHRIMANYMPHNNRSAKLLRRLGFVREGLAKNYLQINGKWENHILTSLTNCDLSYVDM